MGHRSALVRALRTVSRQSASEEDLEALMGELNGDSDRAVMILLGTYVEDMLSAVLEGRMRPLTRDEEDAIFGHNGPLATFSAKINLAYGLSILGPETRDALNKIRELRNACAHSMRPLSFATKEVVDVARSLPLVQYWRPLQTEDDQRRLRVVFMEQCRTLILAMRHCERDEATETDREKFLP